MSVLAAIHLDPIATWLPALAAAGVATWQIAVLAREGTPSARRWIRGGAIVVGLFVVGCIVAGASHVDRSTHPRRYLAVWTSGVAGLALLVMIAAADFVASMVLLGRKVEAEPEGPSPTRL